MSKLARIAAFDDLSMAYIARSRLEAADILCFLANEYMIGLNWLYSGALGGVQLWVPEGMADAARELLAQELGPEDLADVSAAASDEAISGEAFFEPEAVCPNCGRADIRRNSLRRPLGALSMLTGIPLPFAPRWCKCDTCGHRWRG